MEAHLSKGAGEMYLYNLGGDRSDRSLPRNDLHPDSYTKTPVGAKPERVQDLIRRQSFFLRLEAFLRDAATSMQI